MQLTRMSVFKTLLLLTTSAVIAGSPQAFAQAAPAANPVQPPAVPAPAVPAKPAAPLIPPPARTPPPVQRPERSGVSIRVEQPSRTVSEGDKRTVTRSLKIFVTNSSTEAVELKVKYAFFGRDAAEKDAKTIAEGDRAASVKPRSTEIVETNTATAVLTESKYDAGTRKRTPASGVRFVGYGVKVFSGDKLVAETFDPMSAKDFWGKTTAEGKAQPNPAGKPDRKNPGTLGL